MKKIILLFLFLIITESKTEATCKIDTARKLMFTDTIHSFDTVCTFQKLTCNFKFTAKTTALDTVRILGISSPCGCTIVQSSKTSLVNGEDGNIQITYTTDKIEEKFEKQIIVKTNCDDSIISLRFTGVVIRGVESDPYFVNLEDLDTQKTKAITITWKRPEPLRWKRIQKPSFLVVKDPVCKSGDKRVWTLQVSLKNGIQPDFYNDSIRIYTESQLFPVIEIPVKGKTSELITVTPSLIDATLQNGVVNNYPLLLISKKPVKKIISVNCDSPLVRYGQPEKVDNCRFTIPIAVSGEKVDSIRKTNIEILVDIGSVKSERIEIPVTFGD